MTSPHRTVELQWLRMRWIISISITSWTVIADMRPVRVLDDGQHTYIFYPNDGRFREVPTLMIDVNGKTELVNFRVDGNRYVVDRLFDKGVLLLGVGKKQKKVTITRAQDYAELGQFGREGLVMADEKCASTDHQARWCNRHRR